MEPSSCPFPLISCADDLNTVGGDVITTSCLLSYGLCLLRRPFTILLCWRCKDAIPLNCVDKHLKSEKWGRTMVWQNGAWARPALGTPSPHVAIKGGHVAETVKANLVELGIIKEEGELMTAKDDGTGGKFREAAVPQCFPNPSPPLPGLRLYTDAFQCPVPECSYWCLSKDTVKKHRQKYHNGQHALYPGYKVSDHPVQCLYSNYARYFPVQGSAQTSGPLPAPEEVPLVRLSPADLIEHQRQAMLCSLVPQVASQPEADYYRHLKDRRLQPYLESSKIEGWLSRWDDRAEVFHARQDHLDLKRPPPAFVNLRRLVVLVFLENTALLEKTHHNIQLMLTNSGLVFDTPCADLHCSLHITRSRARTIQAYSAYEVHMLWVLCQHALAKRPSAPGSKTRWDVFQLAAEQLRWLLELHKILEAKVLDEAAGKAALRQAVAALYFPKDLSPGNTSVFDFPPVAYIITTIIDRDGAYIHPHLMTPGIAKLSYSFRVHANWQIAQLHRAACTPGAPEPQVENVVREGLSWWSGDVLHTEDGEISLATFRSKLWQSALEIEAFYESRIFMGLGSLDDFIKLFGVTELVDDLNNSEKGFGVSHENRPGHKNEEFSLFLQMLVDGGHLGFAYNDTRSQLVYDVDAMDTWLADVDLALRMLYPLIHFTQGPPGRGTEELTLQITNPERGVKRNVIWDPIMQTGGFNCDYQKTSARVGVLSNILRLVPFRIFSIAHFHMRIVRPMEATYALMKVKQNQRITISAAYSTQFYISNGRLWTTEDLSTSIANWSQRALGVTWTLRSFRHFSALFARKELQFEFTGPEVESVDKALDIMQAKEKKSQVERLRYMNGIVDTMRGHSPGVAGTHYGREVADGGARVDHRAQQRVVIRAYHKALGLSTTYRPLGDEDAARKEKYRERFDKLVLSEEDEESKWEGARNRTGKKKKNKKKEKNEKNEKNKQNKTCRPPSAKQGPTCRKSGPVAQGQEPGAEREGIGALVSAVAGMSIEVAAGVRDRYDSELSESSEDGDEAIPL
ncbi:hypothetical protein EST38_g14518, partial [Candolleomyces aberdarensis]